MNYRSKKVKDVDTQELLFEILQRQGVRQAPQKTERFVPHVEALVPVGKDHTASITLGVDSKEALYELVAKHNPR